MGDDDWVKFGYSVWLPSSRKQREQALDRYKRAWSNLYTTAPLIDEGHPLDLLNNREYTCHKEVPWRPQVEATFSDSIDTLDSSSFPSSAPAAPRPRPSSSSMDKNNKSDELANILKDVSCQIEYDSYFPRIKSGLLEGFKSHLDYSLKNRLLVVFPILPRWVLPGYIPEPSSMASSLCVDQKDVDAINGVTPGCMQLCPDQSNCPSDKVRYYCSSWVSKSFRRYILSDYTL